MNAPQAMEVIERISVAEHQHQHAEYFDNEAGHRREGKDVVHDAYVKHDDKYTKDSIQRGCFTEKSGGRHRHDNTEKHRRSTKNRHRHLLKLSLVRIVNYIFGQCNLKDLLEDPPGST